MRLRLGLLVVVVVLAGCGSLPTPGPDASSTETTQTTTSDLIAQNVSNPEIGRQNGYAYDTKLSVNTSDGLNKSEREAVVSRAMARVERVRGKAFKQNVPVTIRSRSEFKQNQSSGNISDSFRRFDNAKFEAMFLVGEETNSLATQSASRGQNILGYYSYKQRSIVIVSDSKMPTLNGEKTLAHELTHALQDQHFNLSSYNKTTRDEYNAVNSLIEGEANLVQRRYMLLCAKNWDCLSETNSEGGSPPSNWGVYLLNYFPYAEGFEFVATNQQEGGWERVDQLHSAPPTTTEQVINPEKYDTDQPANVTLRDRARNGWERVRLDPSGRGTLRPDYAELGQSGLTVMFAQTTFDSYNKSSVISRNAIYNTQDGLSTFNYGIPATSGWDGDRFHAYQKDGETGYVWKLEWDSPQDAAEFARAYRQLLSHWGGQKTGPNTWVIEDSPYADAFSVRVTDKTVVVVNAPTEAALADVRPGTNNG